jgi:hypothetical protein
MEKAGNKSKNYDYMKDLITKIKILYLDLLSLTLRVVRNAIRTALSQVRG